MRNLSLIRSSKGYTQERMAQLLNISLSAYQFYEYGTRDGSVENWLKLENILGISVKELFKEVAKENSNMKGVSK